MIVSDVWQSLSDALGTCDENYLYAILNEAVELGANKGLYDPLIGYLDIRSGDDNLVYLPKEVDSLIKININRNPSFFRDRLFEFSLNTDGSVLGDSVGHTWEDRIQSPVQATPLIPITLSVECSSEDEGKKVTFYGVDEDGKSVEKEFIASTEVNYISTGMHRITRVSKEESEFDILVYSSDPLGQTKQIALYQPLETEPMYRVVRVSMRNADLRIMFRRSYFKISNQNDLIPLHHKLGVIMLCLAVKSYRDANFELASAYEAKGYQMLEERQASLSSALTAASQDRVTATNQNIGVADAVVVADIYDEACEIFGSVGRKRIYDNITEAVKILRDQALWDIDLGFVDLITDKELFVTLPRHVGEVLAISNCCGPLTLQNKWYQFHVGGSECSRCDTWQRLPEVVPVNEIVEPLTLELWSSNIADNGKKVVVYGIDEHGIEREETISSHNLTPVSGAVKFASISRIRKEETEGFLTLHQTGSSGKMIGHYYPDELEPKYARIRLGYKAKSVRMAYRLRQIKISSMQDFVNIKSRQAVLLTMRGIEAMKADVNAGNQFIASAVELLSREQAASNAGDTPTLQVDPFTSGTMGGGISIPFC